MKSSFLSLIFTILTTLVLMGCGGKDGPSQTPTDGRISPIYDGPAELSYCTSVRTFPSSVTINGTATYQARELDSNGLGAAGTAKPIRRAEVRITDSTGSEVQCAETDASGEFSFTLPAGGSTYTVSVLSRSNNNYLKATVFDAPERNTIYALTTTTTASTNKTLATINAPVTGELLGGPFNILDQLLAANEYLRTAVGSCSGSVDNCTDFTVAPKVKVYWEKGFNPNAYFDDSGGVSFYLPGYSRLFILGGINGDTDNQDTDHFDNSIILHEYGHFLEDVYSDTDSPGGGHYGNSLIDPRLAWSEGWGNFIQAAVLDDPRYIDTRGNIDGSTGYIFKIDLETPDVACGGSPLTPGCDVPVLNKEGNFREFAITRFMWDTVDSVNDSESVANGFPELWASITGNTGFLSTQVAFRSIGFLHMVQDALTNGGPAPITDWSALRTLQKQSPDRSEYAQYVTGDSTTCSSAGDTFTVIPYDDLSDNGSFATSHLLRNNDFYHLKHSGGTLTLTLNYQTTGGTDEADLDLYLYNESARYGISDDIIAKSLTNPDGNSATAEQETLTVSVPAGNYLVNVMVYRDPQVDATADDETDYEIIETSGERLCPTNLP